MKDIISAAIANAPRTALTPTDEGCAARQEMTGGAGSQIKRARQEFQDSGDAILQIRQLMMGGTIDSGTQNTFVRVGDRRLYFVLHVTGALRTVEPCLGSERHPLLGGTSYCIRATAGVNPHRVAQPDGTAPGFRQFGVKVPRKVDLFLEAWYVAPHETTLGQPTEQMAAFDPENVESWVHDFRLTLPDEAVSGKIKLSLKSREVGSESPPSEVAALEVTVAGRMGVPEPRLEELRYLPAHVDMPERTAFLHVYATTGSKVKLRGYLRDAMDRGLDLAPIAPPPRPEPSPQDLTAYARELLASAKNLAADNPGNITRWFKAIVDLYHENCCVVVVDFARACIPWELFPLHDGRYLGSHAVVTRFIQVEYGGEPVLLRLADMSCSGRLAAYLDPQRVAAALAACPSLNALANELTQTPEDLGFKLLGTSPITISLVYLDSAGLLVHGDEGDLLAKWRSALPSAVEMRFEILTDPLPEPRPLFFVNSPFSGEVICSETGDCGLVYAVLRQLAGGYIGTIGHVPPDFATEMAQRMLDAAAKPEGVCPAELLRQVRYDAAKALRDNPTRDTLRRFLHTFMYIYYGNPRARFCLAHP